jgi:aminoacyl tRNA synthase complex-interacting multifunctional protein 1
MSSKMELFLYDDDKSLFLRILSHYVNAEKKNIIKIISIKNNTRDLLKLPNEPFLVSNGEMNQNEIEIAYRISTIAGRKEDLFSVWNGDKNQSLNYFNDFKKEFENLPNFIEKLNKLLEVYTFLNEFHITLLDIYTYSQIIRYIVNLADNERNKNVNIIRWINHLQNLENLRDLISELKLNISIPYEPLILLKEEQEKQVNKKAAAKEAAAEKAEFNRKQKELRMAKQKEEGNDTSNTNSNNNNQNNTEKPKTEQKQKIEEKPKTEEKKEIKKEEKKEPKKQKAPAKKEEDDSHPISKLDIRVGKIISVVENTESDKLYNEMIDMGKGEVRKIASGLKGRIPIENLKDAYVVVLCNLKERTLKGWPSHGMLLCASREDGSIETLKPPIGSEPGDLVTITNFPRTPVEVLNAKKNPWDEVKNDLRIDAFKVAQYKNENTWVTPKGKITVDNLNNSVIS